jgi:endo-1,4-beta-xylanase
MSKKKKTRAVLYILVSLVFLFVIALARDINSRQPAIPELPEPALKELASQHGIVIGNFAIRSKLKDPIYKPILTRQFNVALVDNTPNWYFTDGGLRPTKDTFYFDHMDEVMSFASEQNMNIQAHHFLWGDEKWLPSWLKNGNYTKDELLTIIRKHIQVVGSRYAGRINEWTVVNEAFSRGQHVYGLNDWWADHTGGKEYIDEAFKAARAADPYAKLLLNDFGNESYNDISNETYLYLKSAKERKIPIDGIGMQMHIDGTHPPTKDEVVSNMKRFGELGLGVYVTELDVNMNDVKASSKSKQAIQADIYYEMARACIESKVCKSFSILGITDAETWYNYMGLKDAQPLIFDKKYRPKPAFYSLRDAFAQK